MRLTVLFSALALCLLLTAGCSSTKVLHMYSDVRAPAEEELATVVIAAPFILESFDKEPVEKGGKKKTILRVTPGLHTLSTKTMESTIEFEARPGWIYFLSVTSGYASAWNLDLLGEPYPYLPQEYTCRFHGGPHPFITPQGHRITFDLEKDKIIVENENSTERYKFLAPRYVSFSPRGRHLAFETFHDWHTYIVRDGELVNIPIHASHMVAGAWSLDGQHFACPVFLWGLSKFESKKIFEKQKKSMSLYVLLDDRKLGPYGAITEQVPLFFDLEGNLVLGMQQNHIWYVVRGEEKMQMESEEEVAEEIRKIFNERNENLASLN